ncbi:MAG: APC family permease [Chitinophagaceae bacterium]|nr:APC family permease [Chitinophagaceae bacterium]
MKLKQQLNLFSFTMIVVGLVIGMGIFRTAATAAKNAIEPSVYFTAWIIGGFIAFCGALTYAEIGSRMPVTGGFYKVFSYAYHPSIAFSVNCVILISNAASVGGVAMIGTGYLFKLFPQHQFSDIDTAVISSMAVLTFYGINLLGLRLSSLAQNILMLIKIGMLLLLISCLFSYTNYAVQTTEAVKTIAQNGIQQMSWIQSLGVSLIAVSFTYGGYQQTINFGNEVKHPSKNIPKGIFYGIAIIIILYLLVSYSYYAIIGFNEIKTENEIAFVLINKVFGTQGANVFSVLLFIGVLAYVNALMMSNPRVMYAMGEEGSLPKIFTKQNKKTEALTIALTAFASLCVIILFFAQTFERILNFSIFLDCFGMIASASAVFILRKRTKHLDDTGIYKMKLYPYLTIIFIAAYLFVGVSITMQTPDIALTGLYVLIGFIILYFLFMDKKKTVEKIEET